MFKKKLTDSERSQKLKERDYKDPITKKIVLFLDEIGIKVEFRKVRRKTILPGIRIVDGVMTVDESKLLYPGDLLHEAGHLAVMPKERRENCGENVGTDGGEEMMAISWSYAAGVHLDLDLTVVFHDGGYRGWSDTIIESFKEREFFAVQSLQWIGLTVDDKFVDEMGGVEPFPHMIKWLRD